MTIVKGNKVKIEYEGSLDSGEVFDASSRHGQLLEFTIGEGKVIPGFENGVIGMNKGEEKTIKILPKDGYGEKNPEMIQKIPKEQLPEQIRSVKKGMVIGMQSPDGRQFPVLIADVSDTDITIDLNHPLAGKNLNFKIKVVEVE
ncbi:MAG: peptidylprolyl isomerase [archaeon]|nr:peptidylprolyl isomerase [archaeon]